MEHALNFINIEKSGSTIAQLTAPMVYDIEVPIPSIGKQQNIIDEIKSELDKQKEINKQIRQERNRIDEIIKKVIN